MSLRQPQGQTRAQYGRDFGNFASLAVCPNAASYAGTADAAAMLEVGDTAYVTDVGVEAAREHPPQRHEAIQMCSRVAAADLVDSVAPTDDEIRKSVRRALRFVVGLPQEA